VIDNVFLIREMLIEDSANQVDGLGYFPFVFSPSSAGANIASVQSSEAIRKYVFSRTGNAGWPNVIRQEGAGKTDSHNCK
jgi:hypothetical protein